MSGLLALAPAPGQAWPGEEPPPGALVQLLEAVWAAVQSTTGQEWTFAVFAILALGCGILTVASRNPVVAAVWLVGSFCSVAVCYVLMSATFLAALQVLVYAGAMMVLFVFVVMVLDVDEAGRASVKGARKPALLAAGTVLLGGIAWILLGTITRQVKTPGRPIDADFCTATTVGRELFGPWLFAFEAISLLLLAAVIGAVVVARSRRERLKEARADGLADDALEDAGLAASEDDAHDLSVEETHRPHPVMDFGQPSAGGHEGGT
ncbi:MAG: NADH-quinone oxidoreductase subunit J [Myxococcota bacterium]